MIKPQSTASASQSAMGMSFESAWRPFATSIMKWYALRCMGGSGCDILGGLVKLPLGVWSLRFWGDVVKGELLGSCQLPL